MQMLIRSNVGSVIEFFFLQVKTMRALQYFPTIEDPSSRRALFEVQPFYFQLLYSTRTKTYEL